MLIAFLMTYLNGKGLTVWFKKDNKFIAGRSTYLNGIGELELYNKVKTAVQNKQVVLHNGLRVKGLQNVDWGKFLWSCKERIDAHENFMRMNRKLVHKPSTTKLTRESLEYVSQLINKAHGRSAHLRRVPWSKDLVLIKGSWINISKIQSKEVIKEIGIFLDEYNGEMVRLFGEGKEILTLGEWKSEVLQYLN